MEQFQPEELAKLYLPPHDSHKGQNGKLLLIGGSRLFHAASLWPLTVASRIVDMVFYASVPENNQIVQEAKKEFRDGIVVPRESLEDYINEADCILIGPGMVRSEHTTSNYQLATMNLKTINTLEDEGEQTYQLTKYLLQRYPEKRWVIDGGALQMLDPEWLKSLTSAIITPHQKEFSGLELRIKNAELRMKMQSLERKEQVAVFAKEYTCIVLAKGNEDVICSSTGCVAIPGGTPGMTKGGTGDVLAGLVAALACKNDLFLSAKAASYINKKAGESLAKRVGVYFNASDLASEIPKVLAAETQQLF